MAWRSGMSLYACFLILAVIPFAKAIPEISPIVGDDLILDPELTSETEDEDQPFMHSAPYDDFPEDDEGQDGIDEADLAGSSGRFDDVDRLMTLLRATAVALARGRDAWRLRDQQHQQQQQKERSKKRQPVNSFVRIGRAGATSPVPQGDVQALGLVQLLLAERTRAQSILGAGEDGDLTTNRQSLLPADGAEIGRAKRWSIPKNFFVRIGRNGGSRANDIDSPMAPYGQRVSGRFLRPARNGYGSSGRGGSLSVNRRASFVRIGRLPSTVFQVPNLTNDELDDTADDSLEARRSPGYRLTQTGFVRGGRRKRGTFNDVTKAVTTSQQASYL